MTPIRQQYLRIKKRYPEAIVFFRLGDFYETFDEDAKVVSRELGIVLTTKPMGKGLRVPLAGIPYHAVEGYLAKLIQRGYKVALCEQLSDPATSKGLVERDVVRVVTPGTVVEPGLLEDKANNYLAALVAEGGQAGIAYADITTGEFAATQVSLDKALPELGRLRLAELLVPRAAELPPIPLGVPVTRLDELHFALEETTEAILTHFGAISLDGFGCAHLPLAARAAGAILRYLQDTQRGSLSQLTRLETYSLESYMALDEQTRRNLELFQGSRSLLSVLDTTRTAMGARLLRRWLGQPLLDLDALTRRQEAVASFFDDAVLRVKATTILKEVADIERLVNRIRGGHASPKEVVALGRSLDVLPKMRQALSDARSGAPLGHLTERLLPCEEVTALIRQALVADPPADLSQGGAIRPGFSPELDEVRAAVRNARQYLAGLEREERERTGIKSLKVGYNKVFGYYIEVSNANKDAVPADYIRKQTLVGAERYFTPRLKEYETMILGAQERISDLEGALFRQVCGQIGEAAERLLSVAAALAELDVFSALAEVAVRNDYVRPKLDQGEEIVIREGRHPVVELSLSEEGFIPNDTVLSNRDAQIIVLTGPNMSGKSTYLRQVALIVLMAQVGSYVPAREAAIGLVDRIFTRVGAQDDLAAGRSTFMVEMVETANILHNATSKSLIILDEVGRGTSTYDGLSIAWAVVEFLHSHPQLGAKTLFATHYHELVELATVLPRVRNFNVAVAEEGGEVVFLRKIVPGGADKSYGIHVAQLAGLPRSIIRRAREVLAELEASRTARPEGRQRRERRGAGKEAPLQLTFFGLGHPVLDELKQLDITSLTPLEAILKLHELQQKANGGLG